MQSKLTLTVEQEVIVAAKNYAKEKGRSLSDIIENYLKNIVSSEKNKPDISPKVKKLMGVIELPQDFDYKKTLSEEISKKHMK